MPLLVSSMTPARTSPLLADVVFTVDGQVRARSGRVVQRSGRTWELDLTVSPPTQLERDTRIVLDLHGGDHRRYQCAVLGSEGRRLRLLELAQVREDKRAFPRHFGAIQLRWRLVRDQDDGPWTEPDPFMSFSIGGLAFGGRADAAQLGDLVELDFAVAQDAKRHAAIGRVIRVAERPSSEVFDDETQDLAVAFVDIAPEGREALAAFTLRIQRALAHEH
ncbi:MAG: PilZ domain-containing protein [Bradymonadia bacterium]|jgi:hypothetical protein